MLKQACSVCVHGPGQAFHVFATNIEVRPSYSQHQYKPLRYLRALPLSTVIAQYFKKIALAPETDYGRQRNSEIRYPGLGAKAAVGAITVLLVISISIRIQIKVVKYFHSEPLRHWFKK